MQRLIQKYEGWKCNFNKRNEEYYIEAFRKLDEGIDSWNWAGFFLGCSFLAYRKAYWSALLITTIEIVLAFFVTIALIVFSDINDIWWSTIAILVCFDLFSRCFVGYFGNRIYYRSLKKKVRSGYHVTSNFYPVASTFIFVGIFENLSSDVVFLNFILIPLFWFFDYASKYVYFRTHTVSEEDITLTEKNICNYLGFNKPEGSKQKVISYISMVALLVFSIINYEGLIYMYTSIADQLLETKKDIKSTIMKTLNQNRLEYLMKDKDKVINFDLFSDDSSKIKK